MILSLREAADAPRGQLLTCCKSLSQLHSHLHVEFRFIFADLRLPSGPNFVTESRGMLDRTGSSDDPTRFRLFADTVSDYSIATLDRDGRITGCNPATESIYGHTVAELIGQPFSRFFGEEDEGPGKSQTILQSAATQGRHVEEGWRTRKNQSRFWALATVTTLRDVSGQLLGYGQVTQDLTERKKA